MPGLYGNGAGNVTVPAGSTSGLYQLSQDINVVQDTGYGNANVANYLASGALTSNVITSGNVQAGYFIGDGSQLTNIPGGNVVGGYGNANVVTLMANFGSNTISTTGNITGGYIFGNGSQLTGLPATYSNTNATSLLASFGSNTITTTGNITGGYFIGDGSQLTGLPASYGNANVAAFLPTYTGNLAGGNLAVTNNGTVGGNLTVSGTIYGTFAGNISGNLVVPGANTDVIFNSNGNAGASSDFTYNDATKVLDVNGNITGGNISATNTASANIVNVTTQVNTPKVYSNSDLSIVANGANINMTPVSMPIQNINMTSPNVNVTGQVSVSGNVTGSNIIGNGQYLTNLPGANVTGTVANATYATSAGSATTATHATTANTVVDAAQANITSVGTLTGLTVSGDQTINGNLVVGQDLTVNGNTIYTNITELNVQDPIISQGRGPNNTPLVSNDGKDRGEQFWYYSGSEKSAFSGYDNSAGKMLLATDVSIANEIVTVNELGNIVGGNIEATSVTTSGNVTASYVFGNGSQLSSLTGANVTGTVPLATSATTAGTVTTAAQPNITSVGTLSSLSVTGNISGGNVNSTFYGSGAGLSSLTGANVTGTVANATYAVSAGSATTATTAGTVTTAAQPNITSVGTLSSLSVTGNTATGGILTDNYYYANGTPISFGGTYGDSNVNTLLSSWGSNTLNTTGNITGGNIIGTNLLLTGNISNPTAGVGGLFVNVADGLSVNANAGTWAANIIQADSSGSGLSIRSANEGLSVKNAAGSTTIFSVTQTGANVTGNIGTTGILTDGYYYANGTPVTFGGGSTYGNSNVSAYLASGTNTANIITTGNVTGSNLITSGTGGNITGANNITATGNINTANLVLTGQIYDTSGVLQLNGSGNVVLVPTGSIQLYGPTDIIGGKLTTGAVTYANTDGTTGQVLTTYGNGVTYFATPSGGTPAGSDLTLQYNSGGSFAGVPGTAYYTGNGRLSLSGATFEASGATTIVTVPGTVTATGNITGGNLIAGSLTYTPTDGTAGQVLTTYGNGKTYFSTVSGGGGTPGGSNTQIQFNDAGSFAGNANMTFDKVTGNVTIGSIVTKGNIVLTTGTLQQNTTPNTTNVNPGAVVFGNGYDGTYNSTTYLSTNSRNSRIIAFDKTIKYDNGSRSSEIASQVWYDLNGSTTFGTANANSRLQGISSDINVINGNIVATNPVFVRGTSVSCYAGTSANTGNANVQAASSFSAFLQPYAGSRIGTGVAYYMQTGGASATTAPFDTFIGVGISTNHAANTSTGNVFGIYNPSNTNTYGFTNANTARGAANYYFLRNDDDAAQNKLGSVRLFHEYRANPSISSGALTIDKSIGQVQYVDVTEAITSITLSNFVTFASDGTNTDGEVDTVTVIFRQDSTGRSITMPSGSAYKYAGGVNTVGSTANSVSMVSITALYNLTTAANEYLITISPEFS